MLLEKSKFSDGDVITLKLSSGEEIIAKYVSEDLTSITVEKALMLAMSQKGIGMAPYVMTVDPETKLSFNKHLVMLTAESDKDIANQYIYQTTGIQPVSAGSIITS
jgi:hypothetical protein